MGKLAASLAASRRLSVHRIGELVGEALVPPALRRPLYEVAAGLPGAETLASASDMLGRSGLGVARLEGRLLEELIFDPDSLELLARRMIVVDAARGGVPPGAAVGSICYLARELVHALPAGIPPIPGPPCSPSGGGTVFSIEPGFTLSTGYFTDLAARLEEWHTQGVRRLGHDAAPQTYALRILVAYMLPKPVSTARDPFSNGIRQMVRVAAELCLDQFGDGAISRIERRCRELRFRSRGATPPG